MQTNKEEILEERLDDFKEAIKQDLAREKRKIEEKTRVEEAEIRKKIIGEHLEKEEEKFGKRLASLNTDAKIRRSAKINEGRMAKMTARYELTQKLKTELRESLKKRVQDEATYKPLLKSLIVQVTTVLLRAS